MKYVLATDGSKHSLKAASWVAEEMPLSGQDEVYLLYVFPLPPDSETLEHLVALPKDASDPRVWEVARPVLDRTKEALRSVEAQIHEVVLVGNPAREIVSFASTQRANLVVVGKRGCGAYTESYLGSVSSVVAHHSLCPVLLVR